MSDFLVKHGIKNETERFAASKCRKDQGQVDLANFVLSKSSKVLSELIEKTWKMQRASEDLERKQKSRIDIVHEQLKEDCQTGCNKTWLECAKEVLQNNKLHPILFASAVHNLLMQGRSKFTNIMITGPTNCGKTLL